MEDKIQAELVDHIRLLHLEHEAEIKFFEINIASKSLNEKRDLGVCWHPVVVKDQGFSLGDYAYLIVERTKDIDKLHQFKAGNVVSVGIWKIGSKKDTIKGVIDYIHKNKMKIILYSKDLPEWISDGGIGVDLLIDERTFREMEFSTKQVMNADPKSRLAHLRNVLMGYKEAQSNINTIFHPGQLQGLNQAQINAIQKVNCSSDVTVIHGPPGTGKTTTLVHAIKYLLNQNRLLKILVCAPSNTAADLLTTRLSRHHLHVTRIGNLSRIDEDLMNHTLDGQISNHPDHKQIKKVRIEAAQARREAQKHHRTMDQFKRAERNMMKQEAKILGNWAKELEDKLVNQILDSSQIICCTLMGSTSSYIQDRFFDYVFIDESGQALEGAIWIAIRKAHQVVLSGDPLQLPPTVKSIEAAQQGLGISLLEKYMSRSSISELLNIQYRMNSMIMGFSNTYFYNNQLIAAPQVAHRTLAFFGDEPLVFIDTAGCGFEEESLDGASSRFNSGEYFILREHIYQLIESFGDHPIPTISIISPYKEQIEYIRNELTKDELLSKVMPIKVSTIDGFQGQEGDIIYISLVRSNPMCDIGFLNDYRRMNVAITRAKLKLVVIGDSATLGQDVFYSQFIDYCQELGVYHSAWEWMVKL